MDEFFICRQEAELTIICFQTESLMNPLDLDRIGQNLQTLTDVPNCRHLLLDLTRVRFLSSQALGLVLTLNKKLSGSGRKLELCGLGPQLLQLLKVTRLDKLLSIRPMAPNQT